MNLKVSVVALLAVVTLSVVSGCSNSSPAKMPPESNMMGMQSEKMDGKMDNSMSSKSEGKMAGEMQPKMDGKMAPEMQSKMDPKMTAPTAETATTK